MLRLHVLASGSSGNAAVVEDSDTGEGILIDCGISKKDFLSRCSDASFDPSSVKAILVTHDHSDHTKGLGVVVRGLESLGVQPAIYTSIAVRRASAQIEDALQTDGVTFFPMRADEIFDVGNIKVKPFRTSHDAAESFGFRFECRSSGQGGSGRQVFDSMAYLTDSGIVTPEAHEAMQYVRILALESNHDTSMLRYGSYPQYLKKRIASDKGHLSNMQAADELDSLLSTLGGSMLESVVAMHISVENNTYDLPKASFGNVLERASHGADVYIARRDRTVSLY